MRNPFEIDALALDAKRKRWDMLTEARKWVVEHYLPDQSKVSVKHEAASACPGYKDAMSLIVENILAPGKLDLLDMIDRDMALLTGPPAKPVWSGSK